MLIPFLLLESEENVMIIKPSLEQKKAVAMVMLEQKEMAAMVMPLTL